MKPILNRKRKTRRIKKRNTKKQSGGNSHSRKYNIPERLTMSRTEAAQRRSKFENKANTRAHLQEMAPENKYTNENLKVTDYTYKGNDLEPEPMNIRDTKNYPAEIYNDYFGLPRRNKEDKPLNYFK